MYEFENKPETAGRIYKILLRFSSAPDRQIDAMKMLQLMAGMMVETALVFDKPDEAACAMLEDLSQLLETGPNVGKLGGKALPSSPSIDQEIEKGRAIAREMFEESLNCSFVFAKNLTVTQHQIFIHWEAEGFRRADMLRLLSECLYRGLAYEIAAQELCDMVLSRFVEKNVWSLADGIAALSATAGHKLAYIENACQLFRIRAFPEDLDNIVYTMTQEAVRLGVPAGTDWRFGLAANDVPVSAPYDLIVELEPYCESFFAAIQMDDGYDQSVACAKAAGRLLAVTAGGEVPEIEPAIAKPLAMAAVTDTYKTVCMEHQIAAY